MLSAPERLSPLHDIDRFDCGKPALNDWLRARALPNARRGFSVVMVVHDAGRVVAFYALAPTAIEPPLVPRNIRTGQPPNPIPCLLLGQLAVDREYARRGIGVALVAHALRRAVASADLNGGRALVVNAVDDEAARFWRARGFIASAGDPYRLFRSMADIRASLAEAPPEG